MRKDDLVRLRHMLDAAQEAIEFVKDKHREDLDNDRKLTLALVKDLEIIGEAAYQITEETRRALPEIPWEDIIGMRHRLVHAYFDSTSIEASFGRPCKKTFRRLCAFFPEH